MIDYPEIPATITPLNEENPLPRLDPARRVFITSRGNEIALSDRLVSSLILERIANDGKPKVPRVEVLLLGKHKELQANPNEPGYLALLEEWQTETRIATMRYIFNVGVKGEPPKDFVSEQQTFTPHATQADIKYMWVCSQLPDEDIDRLVEVILGKNIVTTKGLEDAANFSG